MQEINKKDLFIGNKNKNPMYTFENEYNAISKKI